jgi:DNA (cytosine-5)-methyltransferase 1
MQLQLSLPLKDDVNVFQTPGIGSVVENFWTQKQSVMRRVTAGDSSAMTSLKLPSVASRVSDPTKLKYWWDYHQLRGAEPKESRSASTKLRIVDLFCGCGGFALGVSRAASAVGMKPNFVLAADTDQAALQVFSQNLHPSRLLDENLWPLVDFQVSPHLNGTVRFLREPSILHPALRSLVDHVDVVIGGPPCQGHSNSNNSTRRNDPRNLLYLVPLIVAIATRARAVIIENVPGVARDRFARVTLVARQLALASGYRCDEAVIDGVSIGVPQTRRRHIFIASREAQPDLDMAVKALSVPARGVEFAIKDLSRKINRTPFDTPAQSSEENLRRIDYLFDKELYDLPNKVRPDCHKNGTTYGSVMVDYSGVTLPEPLPLDSCPLDEEGTYILRIGGD